MTLKTLIGRLFRGEPEPVVFAEPPVCSVLFVCMGNICRSPTAEGVFRRMLQDAGLDRRVHVDSAGTHAGHLGSPPDRRSQEAAALRDVDLSRLRARRIELADLDTFDYVLAMDSDNLARIRALAETPDQRSRVRLLLDFAPQVPEREVPDPYYSGRSGFERVLDLIETGAQGLLEHICDRHALVPGAPLRRND